MARSPLSFPALLLLFGATVCLWLSTFSTAQGFLWPIYFLQNNRPNGGNARFGVFGWCVADYCLPRTLGWTWDPQVSSEPTLTRTLVLVPIATAFSTLALFSLIYVVQSAGKVASVALLLALLAFLASCMSLGFVFGLFIPARDRFSADADGVNAELGPAAWMVVAATAALLIGLLLIYLGPYKRAGDYEIVENRSGVIVTQPVAVPPKAGGRFSRKKKTDQSYTV